MIRRQTRLGLTRFKRRFHRYRQRLVHPFCNCCWLLESRCGSSRRHDFHPGSCCCPLGCSPLRNPRYTDIRRFRSALPRLSYHYNNCTCSSRPADSFLMPPPALKNPKAWVFRTSAQHSQFYPHISPKRMCGASLGPHLFLADEWCAIGIGFLITPKRNPLSKRNML